jgi:hypothetical protein
MKSEVIRELHALLYERLFGGGSWLAQDETCHAVLAKFVELGLEKQVLEESGHLRATRRHRTFRVFATGSRDLCPPNPIIFSRTAE